jgi:ribosomal protein S18 acetylase RimI-like enzyme
MLTQAVVSELVRPTARAERDQIVRIAVETGVFNPTEIETVDELLDGYFDDAEKSGYHLLSYLDGERVLGFAVWGPRDLTSKGYDLYWIATRPGSRRRGVGRALMAAVEAEVRARGGYWIWIETSDTPPYAAARSFYESCGYQRVLVLPDFYHDGDGLVVFIKRLSHSR